MLPVAALALTLALTSSAAVAQPVAPAPSAPDPAGSPAAAATPALPAAGIVPSNLSLDITGSPAAEPDFLDASIRAALDRAIRPTLRPGASVAYGPIVPWPLLPLADGTRAAVNVTVTVSGDDVTSASVSGITTVTLNSVDVAPVPPSLLFLSDDPEYLRSEGLIFRGTVSPARPARLYYYHSDVGVPRDLDVVVTATAPARVHVLATASGPDLDVMSVGHSVTRDFLRFRQDRAGTIVDVKPGAPFVVAHTLLLQGEVVAGALNVDVLGGGPVALSVVASPAGGKPDAYLAGPRVGFDGNRRHGTFDIANFGTIAQSYTVGGPPAAVQFGTRSVAPRNLDPSDDGRDFGDYGVVHRVTFTLANPTDDPHQVYIYEKPLGGPVRSTFIVDGQFKELDCVRVPQPYLITTYELAPHSLGASTTETMADGGSFYPLEFGVTEAPPAGTGAGCTATALANRRDDAP